MRRFEYYQLIVGVEDGVDVIYYEGEVLPLAQYMSPVLDHLGEHGWELVTSESMIDSEFIRHREQTYLRTATSVITYLFKREAEAGTPLPQTLYPEEIRLLRQIDQRSARKFDEELSAKMQVETTSQGDQAESGSDRTWRDVEALKASFRQAGYVQLADYPTRVIFTKGGEEVRFDKESETGTWKRR